MSQAVHWIQNSGILTNAVLATIIESEQIPGCKAAFHETEVEAIVNNTELF